MRSSKRPKTNWPLPIQEWGRLHKLRGEHAEARRYLTQALESFERLGTLIAPNKVRKGLAELA